MDLTARGASIEFDITAEFLDYLDKGNRVLFLLRCLEQLQSLAHLAYVETLAFEFDRTVEGISVLLFKRGRRLAGKLPDDTGTGI